MKTSHIMFSETNHEDAIARELNWLLTSDPLWSSAPDHDCVPLKNICKGSVEEIAKNLSNEWTWYGAPKRLGRRFESLLTAMLEQSDACKLLKHGLVVRNNKQTIGEIDYLIELPDSILHLEVAIKFYAGIGKPGDQANRQSWIGPSCRDRLDLKVNHLLNHQLKLCSTAFGQQALRMSGLPLPQSSLGLIYGYLIQPWQQINEVPQQTKQVRRAFWTTHSEALVAMKHLSRPYSTSYGWTLLERPQWIAPHFGNSRLPQVPRMIDPPIQADCYTLQPKQRAGEEKLRLFIMQDSFTQGAHLEIKKGLGNCKEE
ncbi:MAG TPA: hypothetical protein DEF72_05490 [Gammaproteobacteria bacterium]|nr:hypothetical protein [Gammaproteobacteria bacterium]